MTPPILERPAQAWRGLLREQRTAALVSIGLFASMLLPWYGKTDTIVISGRVQATARTLSAFQAFSFVEAAVLLVSAGVLAMLFARGERRDFHLPGGDGTIVAIAGGWAALLIFYRLLDKPGLQGNERISSTVGLQWGIFIALLLALGLLYAGARMRAGEHGQPPLARPGAAAGESGSRRDPVSERAPRGVLDDDLRVSSRGGGEERTRSDARAPVPARPRVAQSAGEGPAQVSGEAPSPRPGQAPSPQEPRSPRGRSRFPPAPADQMSFEDGPPRER